MRELCKTKVFGTENPDWVIQCLNVLYEAHVLAANVGRQDWDFGVEIWSLNEIGISNSRLRWLVQKGFVDHSLESESSDSKERLFEATGGLRFENSSCFIIAKPGMQQLFEAEANFQNVSIRSESTELPLEARPVFPLWDPDRHELLLCGQLVKRFRHCSPNQERVLNVFQEEGWPEVIHDPLIPNGESCPKRRLNDTIKGLNHCQENRLIRFRGDGTGEGVRWELAQQNS